MPANPKLPEHGFRLGDGPTPLYFAHFCQSVWEMVPEDKRAKYGAVDYFVWMAPNMLDKHLRRHGARFIALKADNLQKAMMRKYDVSFEDEKKFVYFILKYSK